MPERDREPLRIGTPAPPAAPRREPALEGARHRTTRLRADRSDGAAGLARFVACQVAEILARHGSALPPQAARDLALLEEAVLELAPPAEVTCISFERAAA